MKIIIINPSKYRNTLLKRNSPLVPPIFFHKISIGSLALFIIRTWSSVPYYATWISISSNLIKVDYTLFLLIYGFKQLLNLSLNYRHISLTYERGLILNFYNTALTDLTELKQTNACPDGLKGFIVSSSNFYSSLSIFYKKVFGSFNLYGIHILLCYSPL